MTTRDQKIRHFDVTKVSLNSLTKNDILSDLNQNNKRAGSVRMHNGKKKKKTFETLKN